MPIADSHAATFYVALNGNNNNSGSEAEPWRSVGFAVEQMQAGDTTYVKAGVYNEERVWFRRSGTAAAPIKLLNYPGQAPTIHCINPQNDDRVVIFNESGGNVATGWITIEGFEIRNCAHGIQFDSGHDLTIRNNWIHHNTPGQGILGAGDRVLIDRNVIQHNGGFAQCSTTPSQCNKDHGLYASGRGFTVTNNLIFDNLSFGIQIATYPFDPAEHAGSEYANSENWTIANNTIAYHNHRGAIVVWRGPCKNLRIENNILYENGQLLGADSRQGIDFVSASNLTGAMIRNNLAFASGSGATVFIDPALTEGVHYTQSGNLANVNPVFVNAPATIPDMPDFALTAQSPAIDAGRSVAEVTQDLLGAPRPQGPAYDIGAYEFSSDPPPSSPVGLTVL